MQHDKEVHRCIYGNQLLSFLFESDRETNHYIYGNNKN